MVKVVATVDGPIVVNGAEFTGLSALANTCCGLFDMLLRGIVESQELESWFVSELCVEMGGDVVSNELTLTFLLGSHVSLFSLALLARSRVASSTVFLISLKGDKSLDGTLLMKLIELVVRGVVRDVVRGGFESLLNIVLLITLDNVSILLIRVLWIVPPISPLIAVFTQLFGIDCLAK